MNNKIRSVIFLIISTTLLLTACGEGKQSGKGYEKEILSHLAYRYNEDFKVIERIGTNPQGYEKLIVSSVDDPSIKFYAGMSYYAGIGDIMKSRKVSQQLITGFFFAYAPELYAEHLNIMIPSDYYQLTLKYGDPAVTELSESNAAPPYVVTGVREEDLHGLSKSFYEILKGLYAHKPPKNISGPTGDFIKLPYSFEGSKELNYVKLGLAEVFPYDSYEVYNQLKQAYDKKIEKVKQ